MPRPPGRDRSMLLVRPSPILFGIIGGAGAAIVMQQSAVTPLTTEFLFGMLIAAAILLGVVLPTLQLHARRASTAKDTPHKGRRLLTALLVTLLIVIAVIVATTAVNSSSQTESQAGDGHCTATINDRPVYDRVVLPENGTVDWTLTSHTGNIRAWELAVEYAWLSYPLDVGFDQPAEDPTKRDTSSIQDYPRLGVGAYRISGTVVDETGGICTGTMDVIVPGNPLTTPMGLLAAVLALFGVAGSFVAGNKTATKKAK